MPHPRIVINGNLVDEVELRTSASGRPIAAFRLATNAVRRDETGTWTEHGEPGFWKCEAWNDTAEAIAAEQWPKGAPLHVEGTITQERYEINDMSRLDLTVTAKHVSLDIAAQHRRNNA